MQVSSRRRHILVFFYNLARQGPDDCAASLYVINTCPNSILTVASNDILFKFFQSAHFTKNYIFVTREQN